MALSAIYRKILDDYLRELEDVCPGASRKEKIKLILERVRWFNPRPTREEILDYINEKGLG